MSYASAVQSAKAPPAVGNADGGTLLAARHASSPSLTRATTEGSEIERALDDADDKVPDDVKLSVKPSVKHVQLWLSGTYCVSSRLCAANGFTQHVYVLMCILRQF